MSEVQADNPPPVMERFDNLMIATSRVNQLMGKRSPGEVTYEESEQGDARRELLRVEKIAIRSKENLARSEASFIESISSQLHDKVHKEMQAQLSNSGEIFNQVLGLSDEVTELLDTLAAKATTISKVESNAAAIPWLYDELLKVVNSPAHRRRDSKGRIIVVESLRTALSFLGIDNLQILFPALVLKRTLAQVTDPYPQIKHKVWQYGLSTALIAQELARLTNAKQYDVYTLGMLSLLGRNAITRMYFRLFDRIQREELRETQQEKRRDEHDALLKIEPSANYLIAFIEEYADKASADVFEHMVFKRLGITVPMRTIAANNPPSQDDHKYVTILRQARTYAQFRMLSQARVIEKLEARDMLAPMKYPTGALELLKGLDLTQLPIAVEVDQR